MLTATDDVVSGLATIRRTLDGKRLTKIANDPSVRPSLGGDMDSPMDLKPIIANPANVAFESEHGGFVLINLEPGLYEAHSLFLPEGRGAEAFAAMRDALQYMFTRFDCHEIVTMVPDSNPPAAQFAKVGGFSKWFTRENCFPVNGGGVNATYYRLAVFDWIQHSDACLDAGEWLHEQFTDAKAVFGWSAPDHEDDDAHTRAAGAALLMFQAGHPARAIFLYNRWAKFARYNTIALVSEHPVVVNTDGMMLTLAANGQLEVLSCPSV